MRGGYRGRPWSLLFYQCIGLLRPLSFFRERIVEALRHACSRGAMHDGRGPWLHIRRALPARDLHWTLTTSFSFFEDLGVVASGFPAWPGDGERRRQRVR